jgi:anti-anti-sigma factor
MQISAEDLDGGIRKISLDGRLDNDGAKAVEAQFNSLANHQAAVIVDMAGVVFLASYGIRVLLIVAKSVAQRGGKLVVFSPHQLVAQVLEAAGLDLAIPLCQSLDDARIAVSMMRPAG